MNNKRSKFTLFFYVGLLLSEYSQKASHCNTFTVYCSSGANFLQKSFKENHKTILCAATVLLTGSLVYCLLFKKNTSSFFNHPCNDDERSLFNSEPLTISNANNLFNSSVPTLIIQNQIKQRPRSNSCIDFTFPFQGNQENPQSLIESQILDKPMLINDVKKNSQENQKVELPAVQEKINCTDLVVIPNQPVQNLLYSEQKQNKNIQDLTKEDKQAKYILYKEFDLANITYYAQLFFTPQLQNKNALNKSMIKSNVQMSESVIKGKIDNYYSVVKSIVESSQKIPINPKFTTTEKLISVIFTKNLLTDEPKILTEIVNSLHITNPKEEKQQLLTLTPFLIWLNDYYKLSQQLPENHDMQFIQHALLNIYTLFTRMYENIKLGKKKYSVEEESNHYPQIFFCMLQNAQNLAHINQKRHNMDLVDLGKYNYKEWFGRNNALIEGYEANINTKKNEANEKKTIDAKSLNSDKSAEKSKSLLDRIKNIFGNKENTDSHNKKTVDIFKKNDFIKLFNVIIEYEVNNLNLYIKLNKNNMYDELIQEQLKKLNNIMESFKSFLNFANNNTKKEITTNYYAPLDKNIAFKARRAMDKARKEKKTLLQTPLFCWIKKTESIKVLNSVKKKSYQAEDVIEGTGLNDDNELMSKMNILILQLNDQFKDNAKLKEIFETGIFKEILKSEKELDEGYDFVKEGPNDNSSVGDEWEEIK